MKYFDFNGIKEKRLTPDMVRLCAIYCKIRSSDGINVANIAKSLNLKHTNIDRLLPAFQPPYTLWEDDEGKLYYFDFDKIIEGNGY